LSNSKKQRYQRNNGGYGAGVPPLPIPNREVKPGCADGTAVKRGRVGRRQPVTKSPQRKTGAFFVIPNVGLYTNYMNLLEDSVKCLDNRLFSQEELENIDLILKS
jgi:hypothetical protein